ncbi:uncharacterized protein [Nicotiana sylvestris]|uniref:uncharacterized protein n=1 Tax=Nicotiana sylvestris TaxID=4096 RepID=UPI00388CE400
MSEYGEDLEVEMEENPFADIEEYIADTNAIAPPPLALQLSRNSTDDDPKQHRRNFLGVCAMHKQNNVSDDSLRLRCFKYPLAGDARKWLQNLPPNCIHSWTELVRAFLSKWFPQSKKSELGDKIFFFKQVPGEHLHESIAKNAADGSFMDKSFARVTQILDKMAKHNQAWHFEDTTGGITYGSPSLSNTIKENQERDQYVQPVSNEDFEEANYVNNSQGGYQRQQYQGQGQPNQWRPIPQGQGHQQWRNDQGGSTQGNWNNNNFSNRSSNPYVPPKGQYSNQGSSSESKLESMLERIFQNQEKSDTSMRNMTELVGSHTASIQKLEMQMRDLSREQNPKQKGTLPSDTIVNPKGGGSGPTSHVMAITNTSGKVIQGEGEQVVEVEERCARREENREEVKEKVKETPKTLPPIPRPPPPFPQILAKKVDDSKLEKFYDILKQLSVNILFVEAFQEMPGFTKYLKDLITKKRTTKNEVVNMTHRVSSIIATTTVQKKEDRRAFTIPCTIGAHDFARALCDNGASINLMSLSIYKIARLGIPRPTIMRFQMANRSIKRPVGIVDDVIVKVGEFHLPSDFVILDCAVDKEIPIILGRSFLAMGRALMDSEQNEIKFCVNDEEVTFQASKGMKLPHEYERSLVIDVVDEVEDAVEMKMEEQCLGEALAAILVNFDGEDMEGYMESVNALEGLRSYDYALAKLSLDLENRATPPKNPYVIDPPQLELKPLPPHLRYKFLGSNNTLPVIVSSLLNDVQVERLLEVFKVHRQAIGWTIADIHGIPALICEHRIQLESETKPRVEYQ